MIYFKHQNIGNSNRFPIFLSFFAETRSCHIMGHGGWISKLSLLHCTGGEKSVMTSELGEDWDLGLIH